MSNQESIPLTPTRQIDYKHKNYSLLRVPVAFHSNSKFALIDTGASASFISDEYLATIPDEAIIREIECTSSRKFRSAAGEIMKISGLYEVKITLAPNCIVTQVFYVLPKLEEEFLAWIFSTTTKSQLMFSIKK